MTTSGERSKYAVSLSELEGSTRVRPEDQVAEQMADAKEPAITEYQLRLNRLLGIEHAG